MSQDFEEYYFEDLEVDELFCKPINQRKNKSLAQNKFDRRRNLKTQKIYNFDRKTKVFQKI